MLTREIMEHLLFTHCPRNKYKYIIVIVGPYSLSWGNWFWWACVSCCCKYMFYLYFMTHVWLSVHQLSNEFKFPIAAFHHAHDTYLVPDPIKHGVKSLHLPCLPLLQGWVLIFLAFLIMALAVTNCWYKREAYRHFGICSKPILS